MKVMKFQPQHLKVRQPQVTKLLPVVESIRNNTALTLSLSDAAVGFTRELNPSDPLFEPEKIPLIYLSVDIRYLFLNF